MGPEDSSSTPRVSSRSARWAAPTAPRSSPGGPYHLTFRLIGIPVLAVAGVLIYRGLRDHFVLPECDSARAKNTLSDVLSQLKFGPLRNASIKTLASGKDEVVCHAILALPDGAKLEVEYSFFWRGATANMKYSISRQPLQSSDSNPPR